MSQYIEGPTRTFTAASAIGQHLRVKTPAALVVATATDVELGTMESAALAAGPATVRLRTAQGTRKMVANNAITAGNPVYAAAAGKVAPSGTVYCGTALEAAGADGDIIEVLPGPNTDISATITGTNAVAFSADADSETPKIALSGQAAGTGNYTTTLKPEAALSGNNAIIVPEADGDTLVAVALAQTLTSKTLTAPIFGGTCRFGHTVTPVAAAGSTVANGGALPDTTISHITSDGSTKGVVLPAVTAAGVVRIVVNNSSTAAELYAESTGSINGLSADASVVVPASKGLLCISTAAKTWIAFDMTAAATAS